LIDRLVVVTPPLFSHPQPPTYTKRLIDRLVVVTYRRVPQGNA